ncbi:MAG: T9SS type A sorting domain-containing protein [Candidatus Kapabacteria bacterium]|nr:T9SS type A sorting domain-containing protein [Ignavibacteriota bacterium]MCW5884488.1 T9SS type A sorting domain-containing protein [Candidatus Kapabacteria bacterium]
MKSFVLSLLLIIFTATVAESQLVNKWESIDNTTRNYTYQMRTKIMDALDKDKLISFDSDVANTGWFVKYTTDGGKTFDKILQTTSFQYDFHSLSFPADEHFYIVGDSTEYLTMVGFNDYYKRTAILFSSFDGGKNWNYFKFDSNSTIRNIDMASAKLGLASKMTVGNYYNNTVISYGDTLLWTDDGFQTIQKITLPVENMLVASIKMFDEDNFVILVQKSSQSIRKYIKTSDRGKTWVDFADAQSTRIIEFVDQNTAFRVDDRRKESNPDQWETLISKTTDGGNSWLGLFTPTDEKWTDYRALTISCADENNILIGGLYSMIYKSTDGGITWLKHNLPNGVDGGIDMEYDAVREVMYLEKDVAYAIAARLMFKMGTEMNLMRPYLFAHSNRVSPIDLKVSWTSVEGALSYRYQLAKATSNNVYSYEVFNNPVLDTIVDSLEIMLPDLDYDQCYYARVKALGEGIESDWFIRASHFCTFVDNNFVIPPKFIKPLSGERIKTSEIEFIWTSVSGAELYEFQLNNMPYFQSNLLSDETTTDTSITIPTPSYENTDFVARVRVNDGKIISEWRYLTFRLADPLSINVSISESGIEIFPNPASDFITINMESIRACSNGNNNGASPIASIEIFDMLGLEVMNVGTGLELSTLRIDISHLPAGMYFIKIIGSNGACSIVEKFVKL